MPKNNEIAIKVDSVYKSFRLPHEQVNSIKSAFTSLFNRKKDRVIETQHALQNVSFEIHKGEFFGIVGRNGSGKSTMLKMLAGIYQPNKGTVKVNGKLVPFIELGVGFNPELTGRENVYLNGALLGFTKKEIDAQYDHIVQFAELENFMDQKLKNYSSGMQVRLAFSVATTAKADVLLVDEVLAVGDADFQRKCFQYFQKLKGSDTTVVFVTHDMNAVREYCDRAILIEKSKIVATGTADKVASEYSKMFLHSVSQDQSEDEVNEKRWGDRSLEYIDVKVGKKTYSGEEDVTFELVVRANKNIEDPNAGFLLKNAAGAHILGTNTQIKRKKISSLKKGQTVKIRWSVPNIFNDGKYYIDPAVVYNGNTQVADWWEEALSFDVRKVDRTPYLVNPDIKLLHSVMNEKN